MAYVNVSATPPHLARACGAPASFTISFWIKATVWNTGQNASVYVLTGTAASPTDGLGCEKHGVGGTTYWAIGNVFNNEPDYTVPGTSYTGWVFVAFVVSAGAYTAYAAIEGGAPAVHATGSVGAIDNAYIHHPFSSPPTSAAKYGAIKTWTAALSAGEIAAEFASKAPVRTSNIHSYLSGDNGSTVGTDQSSAGNNWTVVGSGWTTDTDLPSFAPLLSSLSPADDATGVSVSTSLAATFGENVIAGTGDVKIFETVAPVAAPTVASRQTDTTGTADTTTFTVDWTAPGGGFLLNDIIFIAISKDDDDAITTLLPSSDWKQVWNTNTGTAARVAGIFRRVPAGFSGTNIALVGDSESWAARIWIIQGADPLTDPVCSTPATGLSTAANPANLAFPWGTEPTLVLAIAGGDGNASASAYPSGYANTGTHTSGHTTTGSRSWLAYAELASDTSGSEDPGAFTNTSEDWVAVTVAFRGAPTDTLVETIAITDGSKVSFASATVTIDPAATLTAATDHYVTIDSGAILASDDSSPYLGFADRATWNFTTGAGGGASFIPRPRAKPPEEAPDDYPANDRRRRFMFWGDQASSAPPGIATETDTALAPDAAHVAAPGIATETDAALAPEASSPPGIATETDTALALGSAHAAAPGLATETDSALVLAAQHTAAPGIANETDEAFALAAPSTTAFIGLYQYGESPPLETYETSFVAARRRRFMFFAAAASSAPPGIALETDAALALTSAHTAAPGVALEADTALALGGTHAAEPGIAAETNSAFGLTSVHSAAPGVANETDTAAIPGGGASPGIATETDTALGLTSTHSAPPGLAIETDIALALTAQRVAPPGVAVETDAAFALASAHVAAPGIAVETDVALGPGSTVPGIALETDTAFPLAAAHVAPAGVATETDAALALVATHVAPPGVATEADAAFSLGSTHAAAPGIASETDTAVAPAVGVAPGIAVETSTALELAGSHVAAPGVAVETDSAFGLTSAHVAPPGIATETDLALPVVPVFVQGVFGTFGPVQTPHGSFGPPV